MSVPISLFSFLGSNFCWCSVTPVVFFGASAVFGPTLSIFLLGFRLLRLFFGGGACSLIALSNGLPTLVGVAALSQKSLAPFFVGCGILMFLLHPVGWSAAPYTLLWLIPLVASFFDGIFSRMIVTSFVAHIVGSLIWLYGGILCSPVAWVGLIPRVLLERFALALGGVIFYMLFEKVGALLSCHKNRNSSSLSMEVAQR